jgi:hypothetical protein
LIQCRQGTGPEEYETGGLSECVAHLQYRLQFAAQSIFIGERSLQEALADFAAHYHTERNHQGVGNQLLIPGEEVGQKTGDIACRERLGGLLRYYYRRAA